MSHFRTCLTLVVLLTGIHVSADEADDRLSLIPGTYTLDLLNVDGQVINRSKEIIQGGKPNEFIETITVEQDGQRINQWQTKFEAVPINDNLFRFVGRGWRSAGEDQRSEWRDNNFQYVFQINKDFFFELHNLDSNQGRFTWRRKRDGVSTIRSNQMALLNPLLGTFEGSFNDPGSKAYGASNEKSEVRCETKLSESGQLATLSWTMTQADKSGLFDAKLVFSFDPHSGTLVKQGQTSTGVTMKGTLRAEQNGKLLWERHADTPNGKLFELCLFDLSDKDTLRHVILKRTLDGIPQSNEENEVIVLKRVANE